MYRERPCHEQAAWLARIESEPDFEAVELARIAAGLYRSPTRSERLWNLMTKPSRWPSFLWRQRGARLKLEQRFKGVHS